MSQATAQVRLCYYITGHGYGHATRSLKLVERMVQREDFSVHVVTSSATMSFVRKTLSESMLERITTHERVLDAGAVQQDALIIDPLMSLQSYKNNIHDHHDSLVSLEVQFLESFGCQVVCVDSTPLVCCAAAKANCKVCIVSNFTWDYIYSQMLNDIRSELCAKEITLFEKMIHQCAKDYCLSDIYVQLPGFAPIPNGMDCEKVRKAPLVCRVPRRTSSTVRNELNIPEHVHILLLCFGGGHNYAFNLREEDLPADWVCICIGGQANDVHRECNNESSKFYTVSSDYYVPDMINCAACVLGKIGYGFVSECLVCSTPLIYVTRSHWAEETHLKLYLETNNLGIEMPLASFLSGSWGDYLSEALSLKSAKNFDDFDCIFEAADEICSIVAGCIVET